MKFPLSTLFIVSHKFENAVYSFSLKSMWPGIGILLYVVGWKKEEEAM
uniref:Uncharacterized protein n=1 Tax=Trichinella nativa TaxID=6335 RepID=A0A0V1KI68_9BILA